MAIYKVLVGYNLPNQRNAANVFNVLTDRTDLDDIALDVESAWLLGPMTRICDVVALDEVRVSTLDGSGFFRLASASNGALNDEMAPPNVAMLIRKNLVGRSRGGRMFLPGPSEGGISSSGEITTNSYNALVGAMDDCLARLASDNLTMTVGSGPNEGTQWVVQNLTPDRTVSTQRRRLR